MNKRDRIKKKATQLFVASVKKAAQLEANTTCAFWGYQQKEPKQVKSLRRF